MCCSLFVTGAINQAIKDDLGKCNVGAGLQATVQVFITHSANVFLLEPASHPSTLVRDHVSITHSSLMICKKKKDIKLLGYKLFNISITSECILCVMETLRMHHHAH